MSFAIDFSDFSCFSAELQFCGQMENLLKMSFRRKYKSDLNFNKIQQINRLLKRNNPIVICSKMQEKASMTVVSGRFALAHITPSQVTASL